MRWLDRGLSLLLILGGVGHTFGVMGFYKDPHTLFWSLTDSVFIFFLAAINLLRSWRPGDRALAAVAASGSAANLVIALGFGRLIANITDFRVILFGVLSLGLALFGVRDMVAGHAR
jgi:small-conductance mechanosensitive channel